MAQFITLEICSRISAACAAGGYPLADAKQNFEAWAARDGLDEAMRLLEAKEAELGVAVAASSPRDMISTPRSAPQAGPCSNGLDTNGQWLADTANAALREFRAIVDLGQVPAWMKRQLDRAAAQGRLIKYRGYWNTLSPGHGIGPLKTIWAVR